MDIADKEEFILLLEEKRHNKIIAILGEILSKLSRESSAPEVNINTDTSKIEELLAIINKPSDDYKVIEAIKLVGEVIAKKLEETKIDDKGDQWNFDVKRNSKGYIYKVEAKRK